MTRSGAAERRVVREALLAVGMERPGLHAAAGAVRDWERVAAIARDGYVEETVWAGFVRGGAAALVAEPIAARLREAHAGAAARNTLLLAEGARMQGALRHAGIASVVVKGPGLLTTLYPDVGSRRVSDVDLLVGEEDALRAEEALLAAGARDPRGIVTYRGAPRRTGEALGHGEIGLETASGIPLEIQIRVAGGLADGSDVRGILERARDVGWQGRTLRVPSLPDLVAGLCLHVFDHHAGEARFLPRHLADLAVSVGSGAVGWDEVSARMPPGQGTAALAFSKELLETGDRSAASAARHALAVRGEAWRRRVGGGAEAQVSVARVLFPSAAFMARRYGVRPGSPLLPLLYVWRPIRGAWGFLTGK